MVKRRTAEMKCRARTARGPGKCGGSGQTSLQLALENSPVNLMKILAQVPETHKGRKVIARWRGLTDSALTAQASQGKSVSKLRSPARLRAGGRQVPASRARDKGIEKT